ncbi:MAG TPA: AI-2E family transporter [Acidimicrobiales bacterium]|nr:AI-2E family transporter [Acidimicrobiales bacterium]
MAPPLTENRVVRAGVAAWAVVGIAVLLVLAGLLVFELRFVVVPLVIALFPAALLTPGVKLLRRRGVPPALAALVVLLGFLAGLIGLLGAIGWLVAGELGQVLDTVETSYDDIREWARDTFEASLPPLDQLRETAGEWASGEQGLQARATSAATTTLEVVSGLLFGLLALFFYLKDGERIAAWIASLFPRAAHADVVEIERRVWRTLGAYFRGQILIAAVDAVFIGIGLLVLGVPLALPLALLVFIGGLFPIVGAFVAGGVAVLVALADGGVGLALAVLGVNIVVQQIEGNVLEPLVMGRATELHPLAVIAAVAAGGLAFGILGAFLAVPVTASIARTVGYLRDDITDPLEVAGADP